MAPGKDLTVVFVFSWFVFTFFNNELPVISVAWLIVLTVFVFCVKSIVSCLYVVLLRVHSWESSRFLHRKPLVLYARNSLAA